MGRQGEEVHQGRVPVVAEGGKVGGVEVPVGLGGEGREEGVLTGGEGELDQIPPGQGLAVQGDRPPEPDQAQDAPEEGGFPRPVLPQKAHDLPPGQGEGDVVQGPALAGVGFDEMVQFQHQGNHLS